MIMRIYLTPEEKKCLWELKKKNNKIDFIVRLRFRTVLKTFENNSFVKDSKLSLMGEELQSAFLENSNLDYYEIC